MSAPAPPLSPAIVFEDNHLLVLDKPAGMLSQGDTTGDASAVDWATEYVRVTYHKPGNVYMALLHRTDRPVGGILMLAKTGKAAARMSALIQAKGVQKQYLAVTERAPEVLEGALHHWLAKLPGKNIVRAYDHPHKAAQAAELHYRTLGVTPRGQALLEVSPITGRQHQIRVQLASMGCTILGDVKYGRTAFLSGQRIALLAWRVQFTHPITKQPMDLRIQLPKMEPWGEVAALM